MKTTILALAVTTGWALTATAQPEERALRADGFDLAHENRLADSYSDARSLLRSADRILRNIDRDRLSRANREAFDAELGRRLAAGARGRLAADNARLEEDIERLKADIAAELERRKMRWVRRVIEFPVRIIATAVTGNPIAGSAIAAGISAAVTGGRADEVASATFSTVAAAGISQIAGRIGTEVTNQLVDYGITDQVAAAAGNAAAAGVSTAATGGQADDVLIASGRQIGYDVAARITAVVAEQIAADGATAPGTATADACALNADACISAAGKQGSSTAVLLARLDPADVSFFEEIRRKRRIGRVMKRALLSDPFGGLLTSRNYVGATAVLAGFASNAPDSVKAVQGIDRITSCAIAKDVQLHILDHDDMSGERQNYFRSLENQWSTRCKK